MPNNKKLLSNTVSVNLGASLLTVLCCYLGYRAMYLTATILPAPDSAVPWDLAYSTDTAKSGNSVIVLRESEQAVAVDFELRDGLAYPYISVDLNFSGIEFPSSLVDLSDYSEVRFSVSCAPENIFVFTVNTYDPSVSVEGDILTYRKASAHFYCDETAREVVIGMDRLHVPQWWLRSLNLKYSDDAFGLRQALGLQFTNSPQSPVGVPSRLRVAEMVLHGHDWHLFVWALLGLMVTWGAWALYIFKDYRGKLIKTAKLKGARESEQQEHIQPSQQATVEQAAEAPDETSQTVLTFLAEEYANQNLTLDYAVQQLGINRNKINKILKAEAGLTFSAYLNELRLAEAGRLLISNSDARVATIAHAVGYSNINYFNRVFKSKYGCSPKAYREI